MTLVAHCYIQATILAEARGYTRKQQIGETKTKTLTHDSGPSRVDEPALKIALLVHDIPVEGDASHLGGAGGRSCHVQVLADERLGEELHGGRTDVNI